MKNLEDLRTELTDYIYFHQPQMLIGEERAKTEELIQDRASTAYEMMQTTENVPEAIHNAYINDTRYPQFRQDLEDKITNYIQHNGILKKVTL